MPQYENSYQFDASAGFARRAWQDISSGAARYRLWSYLGVKDVRDRFRGAVFGAAWVVFTTGILAVGLSFIYGVVFQIPLKEYLPYVSLGIAAWSFISASITESTTVFSSHSAYINQIPVPLSIFIYRMLVRNVILLCYRMLVVVVILLYVKQPLSAIQFQAFIGLIVIVIWGFGLGLLLGAIAARFRDIGQAVVAVTTFSFFITPVFWYPQKLSQYAWVVDYNGLYHLLQLIRGPLLGEPITQYSLVFSLVMATTLLIVGFIVFVKTKQKIPYWCQ